MNNGELAEYKEKEEASNGKPTLAVLILNFNYACYVADAIRAALSQTVPFDESIVVNDGSTDGSLAVIRGFEPGIHVIDKPNGGQMDASIVGLEACRCDYVYILDADDYPHEDLSARVRPLLADRPVKVQFQVCSVDAERRPLNSVFPLFPERYGSAKMIADNKAAGFYISPPTAGNIYRRDFLVGLDLRQLAHNDPVDGVPNMIAPYFGAVVSLNTSLASYRVHGGGHSQWDKPTKGLLQGEIDWLHRRWAEAEQLFDAAHHTPDLENTAYVRERRLMIAALEGRGVGNAARQYAAVFGGSGAPLLVKVALGGWCAAMLVPSPKFRHWLVMARRSPRSRPIALNSAFALLKRTSARCARAVSPSGTRGSRAITKLDKR